jgi:hypothetical protein
MTGGCTGNGSGMEDHGMLMGSCPTDHGGDNGNAGTGYRLDTPDGYYPTEKDDRKKALSAWMIAGGRRNILL